ncbi:MAG: winged helix-turn-helix domain-containing protein [Saprospiraceae bacterium]
METPIRFNGYLFHSEIGELIRQDAAGQEIVARLPPQPSKLLKLLLENYPEVVSQEQIQQSIWPEVKVDYEGSIHFCIRQIRAALNDSATDPTYIETVPRRGYRWIAAIDAPDALPKRSPFTKKTVKGLSALAFLFILGYFFFSWLNGKTDVSNAPEKLRIAIMPFQPKEATNTFTGNDIALQLVDVLTNQYQTACEIIGPTTTINYEQSQIPAFIKRFHIDCLINGRFSQVGDTSRLLAEVIRAKDGAHVWVQYFDAAVAQDSIVALIKEGVIGAFLEQR